MADAHLPARDEIRDGRLHLGHLEGQVIGPSVELEGDDGGETKVRR